MASLIRENDGRYRIQFTLNRKGKGVRIGKRTERQAARWFDRIEQLVQSIRDGQPLDDAVSRWMSKLDDEMYSRLVNAGLAERREPEEPTQPVVTLGTFLKEFLEKKASVKSSTLTFYGHTTNTVRHDICAWR